MIRITITNEMLWRAQRDAQNLGRIPHSITDGIGNLAGFLGEEIVAAYLETNRQNTFDCDLIGIAVVPELSGKTIDVKTKQRSVRPKENYMVTVPAYQKKQDCEFYVFVCLVRSASQFHEAWILGYIAKPEFYKRATLLRKGDVDASNGFVVKETCYNLPASELKRFEDVPVAD